MTNVLRQRAEHQFLHELDALAAQDTRTKPPQWKLSPQAVVTYLLGGKLDNGVEISAKYIGNMTSKRSMKSPCRFGASLALH